LAGVLVPHDVADLRLADQSLSVELDDGISVLEPRLMRRRTVADAVDHRLAFVDVLAFHGDSHEARQEILARLQALERGVDVAHGNGEPDARIEPSDPGAFPGSLRRKGDQDTQHAPFNVDQRTAVIDRGYLGVGLQRFAPDTMEGADDAYRDAGLLVESF